MRDAGKVRKLGRLISHREPPEGFRFLPASLIPHPASRLYWLHGGFTPFILEYAISCPRCSCMCVVPSTHTFCVVNDCPNSFTGCQASPLLSPACSASCSRTTSPGQRPSGPSSPAS